MKVLFKLLTSALLLSVLILSSSCDKDSATPDEPRIQSAYYVSAKIAASIDDEAPYYDTILYQSDDPLAWIYERRSWSCQVGLHSEPYIRITFCQLMPFSDSLIQTMEGQSYHPSRYCGTVPDVHVLLKDNNVLWGTYTCGDDTWSSFTISKIEPVVADDELKQYKVTGYFNCLLQDKINDRKMYLKEGTFSLLFSTVDIL